MDKLGYSVRYNVIKKAIELLIPNTAFTRDNRDNAAISHVLSECETVRMPTKHVSQFLITLADKNQYNPVVMWIESKEWDGVSRLDDFYATVRVPAGGEKMKRKLMRKWLIQAVAAAFSPDGIAGQGILTFVGPQNIGKTTWFQRLAPASLDAVLTGHTLDMRSKDSIFIALSYWIVELGELDATFSKSEISALKSFTTQAMDKLRRPYAATESNFGRRTVFGGTVNESQYLNDPTGNRRFWSIEVDGFDLDSGIDMQQLWAEVKGLWASGENWALNMQEMGELNIHNEEFTVVDPIEERLAAAFNWSELGLGNDLWVTATDALMKIGVRDPSKGQTITAGRALKKLNGGQRKKTNGRVVFLVPADEPEFTG
jgi:putative DNA primase/helicase